MIEIVYPAKKPAIKTGGEKELIFCMIRKKWLQVTPEEWVRQNILLYLTETLGYPASLIAVEKKLQLGEVSKRFDIVVYKHERPYILIECKEMNIAITQKTLDQAMRYNIKLQADYFIISNGNNSYGFRNDAGKLSEIDVFPFFNE